MKRFASIKDCSRFSALCDFSSIFCFLKVLVEKDGFFAVFSWERMVFETYAYPFGYFLALNIVKLMKFYVPLPLVLLMILPIWFSSKVRKCPFTLGSPYDIAYLVFFKSSQVFAKHGFASVLKFGKHFRLLMQLYLFFS